jgi:hypothetical protein
VKHYLQIVALPWWRNSYLQQGHKDKEIREHVHIQVFQRSTNPYDFSETYDWMNAEIVGLNPS